MPRAARRLRNVGTIRGGGHRGVGRGYISSRRFHHMQAVTSQCSDAEGGAEAAQSGEDEWRHAQVLGVARVASVLCLRQLHSTHDGAVGLLGLGLGLGLGLWLGIGLRLGLGLGLGLGIASSTAPAVAPLACKG